MTNELQPKIKALGLALTINIVILASTAYLFDGEIHQRGHFATVAGKLLQHSLGTQVTAFRP
jgi:hypothetical protein